MAAEDDASSSTPDEEAAAEAGLVYVSDAEPGYRRVKRGKGFSYVRPDGTTLPRGPTRQRVEALVIPPAWTDVWICRRSNGHLQATGRDVRGRKQYRYHVRWRSVRDEAKFAGLARFGEALPELRARVEADLARRGLPEDKVLAAVVRLLDDGLIRVGNREYVEQNDSYGATTLTDDHVTVHHDDLVFEFVAKSGQPSRILLTDPALAKVVRRCHELGGQELFTYTDVERGICSVTSGDVNRYLQETVGAGASAKTFRTWGGTSVAAAALGVTPVPETAKARDAAVLGAVDVAAAVLHNTRAVCRSSYIHPAVPTAFENGELQELWSHARSSKWMDRAEHTVKNLLTAG